MTQILALKDQGIAMYLHVVVIVSVIEMCEGELQ